MHAWLRAPGRMESTIDMIESTVDMIESTVAMNALESENSLFKYGMEGIGILLKLCAIHSI
jgi:hypothetical protein